MRVKVFISKEEFDQIGLVEEELTYAISKVMNSSYDCDDGSLLLGFGVEQYEVELEVTK